MTERSMRYIRPRSRPARKPNPEKLFAAMHRAGIDAETAERVCSALVETAEPERAAGEA
jgi:hypothetical protein